MGHDTHFLSRLERLDDGLVDFAMTLYRNTPLVKAVVKVTAPKDSTRVAIALSDGSKPPHVLVEADGRFVTCLAGGMKHDLPVISRAAVQEALDLHQHLLRKQAILDELDADRAHIATAMRVLEGPRLSREEIQSLLGWEPVLGREYLDILIKSFSRHGAAKKRLQASERLKARHDNDIQRCWEGAWAAGHLVLGTGGVLRSVFNPVAPADQGRTLSVPTLALISLHMASALRGVWTAATLGDVTIDDIEWAFRNDDDTSSGWMAMLALTAVGLRWPALRDRCAAVFARTPAFMKNPDADDFAARDRCLSVLTNPEAAVQRNLDTVTRRLTTLGADLSGLDASSVLAASFYEMRPLQEPRDYRELADAVAFVAVSEAKDLYLPRDLLDRLPPENPRDAARAYIDFLRGPNYGPDKPPAPAPMKAGRNEPCPCGSGVKFKRCHGG